MWVHQEARPGPRSAAAIDAVTKLLTSSFVSLGGYLFGLYIFFPLLLHLWQNCRAFLLTISVCSGLMPELRMPLRQFAVLGEISLTSVESRVYVTCQGASHVFHASSGGTEQSLVTTYSLTAEFFSAPASGDVLSFCFSGRGGWKKGNDYVQTVRERTEQFL